MLAPQSPRSPSAAMALLHASCRLMQGRIRSMSTVSIKVRMSFTFRTLLSWRLASAEALSGFSSSTRPSFSMYTRLVWLLATRVTALCPLSQPVSRMSSRQGVSGQVTVISVASKYSWICFVSSSVTLASTCSSASASPATMPTAMAASMPRRPPVLGTTTDFTFFRMFPLISASTFSGLPPSTSRSFAAQYATAMGSVHPVARRSSSAKMAQ